MIGKDTTGLIGADAKMGDRNTFSFGLNLYDLNVSVLNEEPKEILSYSILSRRVWQEKQPKCNEMGDSWNRIHKRDALKLTAAEHTHKGKMVELNTSMKADLTKMLVHELKKNGGIIASRKLRKYHAPGVYLKMDDDGYSMRLRVTVRQLPR